jgi:V/A-type H+-transporting ATPase subunit A
MIKNGFLQQSAFDAIDVYSVPEKQVQILLLIMNFYKRGLAVIKAGVPLPKVASLPVKDEIVRLKSSVPNDNLSMLKDVEGHLDEQMGNLERMYRR